jgi:hypothetical protein
LLFFHFNLSNVSGCSVIGAYLDILFFSERLLKKYFTILSSNEWNVTTANTPSFFKTLVALISPKINSLISLLTKILKA